MAEMQVDHQGSGEERRSLLESPERFFITLAEWIADQLDLSVPPLQDWQPGRSPSINFERYVRRQALEQTTARIAWGLDEVDRLFTSPFGSDVFGEPVAVQRRVRMALDDFTFDQVKELNQRHGSPLHGDAEVARYFRLVNGTHTSSVAGSTRWPPGASGSAPSKLRRTGMRGSSGTICVASAARPLAHPFPDQIRMEPRVYFAGHTTVDGWLFWAWPRARKSEKGRERRSRSRPAVLRRTRFLTTSTPASFRHGAS
jgi:hypothetical protein